MIYSIIDEYLALVCSLQVHLCLAKGSPLRQNVLWTLGQMVRCLDGAEMQLGFPDEH